MTRESLGLAVKHLVSLAVAFEVTAGNPNFPPSEGLLYDVASPETRRTLEWVVLLLGQNRQLQRQQAIDARVAQMLPELCKFLEKPPLDAREVRERVEWSFKGSGVPVEPEVVEKIVRHARLPKDEETSKRVVRSKNTKVEGTASDAIARILELGGVISKGAETLANLRYAMEGRPRAGAVKTREHATARLENNIAFTAGQDLVLYLLLLLADGKRNELVEAPLKALNEAVARRSKA